MYNNDAKLNSSPKCGEIWMCDLNSEKEGSVQSGYRPVFILSNDKNNTYASTLNVIPLITKMHKRLPIHVELWDYKAYGLARPSTMLIEQISTVSSAKLDKCIGSIKDKNVLMAIVTAINIQFPIMQLMSFCKN